MTRILLYISIATALIFGCADSNKGGDAGDDTSFDWSRDTGTGAATDTGTGPTTDTGTGPATDTGTGPATDTGTGQEPDTGTGQEPDTGTGFAIDSETGTGTGDDAETDAGTPEDTETESDTLDFGTGSEVPEDTGSPDGGPDMDAGEDTGHVPWDTGDWIDAGTCVELDLFFERRPVRVMILQDRSGSMDEQLPEGSTKWEVAVPAISQLVTNYDADIQFGLDLFTAIDSTDMCTIGTQVASDISPGNGTNIVDILTNDVSPQNATPLLLAMENFTNPLYAPSFMDGAGDSYLLIVSDGMDTCGPEGVFDQNNGANAGELAAVAAQILAEMNIKIYVIGFGDGIDPGQLNAIAAAGGTGRDTFYDAANSAELNDVLNEIGESVAVSCTFDIGEYDPEEVNLDYINIKFDDVDIPRNDGCTTSEGWTWVDDTRTSLHFCEDACNALSGTVEEISLTIACTPPDDIII